MRKSTQGVPQGSILKHALFSVNIDDLPSFQDYCILEYYLNESKLHLSFPVKDIDSATRK